MDVERGLEELFGADARSRRIERVTTLAVGPRLLAGPLFVAAVAVAAAAFVFGYYQLRPTETATVPSASPTSSASAVTSPSASVSASPSSTPSATPSASPAASTTTGGTYASMLGYAIDLPSPWHRSACMTLTRDGPQPGGEYFVPVAAYDERGSDIGSPYSSVFVLAQANPQGLTAHQWAAQDPNGGFGGQIEDVIYTGKPAARRVVPGTTLATYFVASGGRMYIVGPQLHEPYGDQVASIAAILQSFRFISDQEAIAARNALPTAAPSRSAEQVADGVAAALTAKNVDALAPYLALCVTTAGENAGGSFVSRAKYLDDLRAAFASGLVVSVQARPLTDLGTTGDKTIASTWRSPDRTIDRKLMLRQTPSGGYEMMGTLERYQ